jgi:4-amino-4-deoxy-L-arabinose transferase-like glycosyltransferase
MNNQEKLQILFLILFSVFLFLWNLDSRYLTNWDEAWYAAIARNMARSGDFITPIYNGKIWFAASPFYLWVTAIWFKVISLNELGARIFSALASVSTVLLVTLIGKKYFSISTGLIAGIVLSTTIQFLYRGRTGNFDTALTFFITLAFYSFFAIRDDSRWSFLLGASTGLAFLTKGVLGLLPLPLFLLIPKTNMLKVWTSFFVVTLPWHIAAYMKHGQSFINHYFFQYMLSKTKVENPVSGTQVFWYLTALRHGLKVWFLALIPAVFMLFKEIFRNSRVRLVVAWALIPLMILTLARMRNDWYLIFIYPAIAIIIGLFFSKLEKYLNKKIILLIVIILALFNVIRYQNSFFFPETVGAEVSLAQKAQELSQMDETILLDDNYLPVAVFYSDRQVIPLRFSRAYESLVGEEALKIATYGSTRKLALSNQETIEQLLETFREKEYNIIQREDDKILLELMF